MITPEIDNILVKLKNFRGTFPRDLLPQSEGSYPHSIVMNYDEHARPGSHWVCIYVDEHAIAQYFDSYGLPPLTREFVEYLTRNSNIWYWNKTALQCTDCVTCGEYCCAYLILRNSGYSHQEFINLFTNNPETNDQIIKRIFQAVK
jgi:hypothetical protein